MKIRTMLLSVLALAVVLYGVRVRAQGPRTRQVAVAVVDTLSKPEVRAEILRFSDDARPDVILLRRDAANGDALASAIAAYRLSLQRTPARPGTIGRTALTGFTAGAGAGTPLRASADAMLHRLKREPVTRVGNYGPGRWRTFEVRVGG